MTEMTKIYRKAGKSASSIQSVQSTPDTTLPRNWFSVILIHILSPSTSESVVVDRTGFKKNKKQQQKLTNRQTNKNLIPHCGSLLSPPGGNFSYFMFSLERRDLVTHSFSGILSDVILSSFFILHEICLTQLQTHNSKQNLFFRL